MQPRIVFDGTVYGIRFSYRADLSGVVKQIQYSSYIPDADHPYRQYWTIPATFFEEDSPLLQAVAARAPGAGSVASLLQALAAAPLNRAAFIDRITAKIYVLDTGDSVIVFKPFHPGIPRAAKENEGRWQQRLKGWQFDKETSLPVLLMNLMQATAMRTEQFEMMPGVYQLMDADAKSSGNVTLLENCLRPMPDMENPWGNKLPSAHAMLPEMIEYEQAIADPAEIRAFVNGFDLMDYQKDSAVFMATHPGAANFSDQGTGKTRVAVVALKAAFRAADQRKMVVAPANLLYTWRDEILAMLPGSTIAFGAPDQSSEWTLISSATVPEQTLTDHPYAVLMVDEAHQIKEATTGRTLKIMDVAKCVPRVYVQTGTPIPNRESELYTLLRITRHPIAGRPLTEFKAEFCGNPEARAKLAAAIRPWFIRHMKVDVLKLPPKHRNTVLIKPSPAFLKRYEEVLTEDLTSMAKMQNLRLLLESYKADHMAAMLAALPPDEKAIVFTMRHQPSERVAQIACEVGLGVVQVDGRNSPLERHQAAVKFRTDEQVRIYSGTIQANGQGLNLQRGNHSYFIGLPWTAAEVLQAEDREHRIGQTRPVYVHMMVVQGTIEEGIISLINYKAAISDEVLAPGEAEERNKQKVTQLIRTAEREARKGRREPRAADQHIH